ncbi:MAG: NUDIX domain-containing protein [Chthoniobacterales bacterium]
MKRSRTSAGMLMFRKRTAGLEFLLAHPGGPYFRSKDEGFWTIPKGEASDGEDLLERARIEFQEEVGLAPFGNFIALGWVKQKGGKIVHAWGFEGDFDDDFKPTSNSFEIEWPPGSGKTERFPEVDDVAFFPLAEAERKLKAAQIPFLHRLKDAPQLLDD